MTEIINASERKGLFESFEQESLDLTETLCSLKQEHISVEVHITVTRKEIEALFPRGASIHFIRVWQFRDRSESDTKEIRYEANLQN